MKDVVLSDGSKLPLELHKVKIVQKLNLPSAEDRKKNMEEEMDKNLAGRIEQEFFEKESLFVLTVFESGQ